MKLTSLYSFWNSSEDKELKGSELLWEMQLMCMSGVLESFLFLLKHQVPSKTNNMYVGFLFINRRLIELYSIDTVEQKPFIC